jgi:hypothetical protein
VHRQKKGSDRKEKKREGDTMRNEEKSGELEDKAMKRERRAIVSYKLKNGEEGT